MTASRCVSQIVTLPSRRNDLFDAPDWRPTSHGAMPTIVSRGRPPDVYACGYCHTAGGQGRPENASLAGLPSGYIIGQDHFKSGARKSAWREPYGPADRMIHAVTHATVEEISAAADYFAAQSLRPRVDVVERARVPRSDVVGWVYVAEKRGGKSLWEIDFSSLRRMPFAMKTATMRCGISLTCPWGV